MDTRQLRKAAAADFMQSLAYLGQLLDDLPPVSEEDRHRTPTEIERRDMLLSALTEPQPFTEKDTPS